MSDKFYVGLDITGFADNGKTRPISRVTLLLDDENSITAGDDTGRELSASCPHATQAMVDAILANVKGYQYQMYSADAANIDPSAELGDGVTANGIYSVVSRIDDDGSGYAGLSAPGEEELEDEYPAAGPMTQEFNRKISETKSLITKTAAQIRLEVANEIDGLSSSITVELDNIRSEINGKIDEESAQSLINQALDSITLSVSSSKGSTTIKLTSDGVDISAATVNLSVNAANITGTLTASQIDATNLKVSAANITGTLTIGQLPSSVATDSDIPLYTSDLINNSGYTTSSQVTTITNNAISTANISASQITTGTLNADYLKLNGLLATYYGSSIYGYLGATTAGSLPGAALCDSTLNNYIIAATSGVRMSYHDTYQIWVASNGCWTSSTIEVYSDRRLKNSICYGLERYEQFFDALKPASFRLNSEGKRAKCRLGFIAQDVRNAARKCGLKNKDIALLGKNSDGYYGLSYSEIIPLNTWEIQRLKQRVADLERRLQ